MLLGFDLFWKGIEITTGAQREHRLENLKENAKERGISLDSLADYFEYFEMDVLHMEVFALGTERF